MVIYLQMADAKQSSSGSNVQVVEKPNPKDNKRSRMLIIIIVVLVLGLLGVGVWYLLSEPDTGTDEGVIVTETTPEPTEVQEPTNTPEPVDRSEVSIQILNGTGVAGEAGRLQEELEGLDYEDIEVGNADEQDYESAEVTFDADLSPTIVTELTEELQDFFIDLTASTEELEDYDVIIITGDREGMARATATPEPTVTSADQEAGTTATPSPSPSPTP